MSQFRCSILCSKILFIALVAKCSSRSAGYSCKQKHLHSTYLDSMYSLHRISMSSMLLQTEPRLNVLRINSTSVWISVSTSLRVCVYVRCVCVCRPVSCVLCWEGRISSLVSSEELDRSCWASIKEQCSVLMPSIARRISPTCKAPHLRRREKDSKRQTDSGNKVRKSFTVCGAKQETVKTGESQQTGRCEVKKRIAKYVYFKKNTFCFMLIKLSFELCKKKVSLYLAILR